MLLHCLNEGACFACRSLRKYVLSSANPSRLFETHQFANFFEKSNFVISLYTVQLSRIPSLFIRLGRVSCNRFLFQVLDSYLQNCATEKRRYRMTKCSQQCLESYNMLAAGSQLISASCQELGVSNVERSCVRQGL